MSDPKIRTPRLSPGTRLGSYEILRALGAGGMGEVYLARHEKLDREVALKVLPDAAGSVLDRLEREARTASALNHPNIVTIHDIGEHDGTTYIAMERVDGRDLRSLIAEGPSDPDRALAIAAQIAEGLAKAHQAGIVHRDIKPENVMVTRDGLVKILDFGLARTAVTADPTGPGQTAAGDGSTTTSGTPSYMAPEQWSGEPVDHRSDQYSFGVLLYELVAGARPFEGPSLHAVMTATVTAEPPSLRSLRPGTPIGLERAVMRCLEKAPEDRFASTDELAETLRTQRDRRDRARHGLRATLRKPVVAVPLATVLIAATIGAGLYVRGAEERWARTDALPEIETLIDRGELYAAFRTGTRAAKHLGDDPRLERLVARFTLPVDVHTDPPGAEVRVSGYHGTEGPWQSLGTTPLSVRVPYAALRWRIEKDGYEPFFGAPFNGASFASLARGIVLEPEGHQPPGMVRIPGGILLGLRGIENPDEGPLARLDPFYMDRYEVTNQEYQAFLDAGGYRESEWWPTMRRGGAEVGWPDAVAGFVDATGRPGPATWRDGTFPDGEESHPVSGISWFEAAAYCAFAGKSLPTIYHWSHAIGQDPLSDILNESNISGVSDGVAPAGRFQGLAGYGTYDMAGNVKEWAWNATGPQRYILGGAWDEPGYLFRHLIGEDPWTRVPEAGVRCALYLEAVPADLLAPATPQHSFEPAEPMDDETFRFVRSLYSYDRDTLEARVESVTDSLPEYRRERVSFRTAYDNERMYANLLIPHDVEPPYQSVLWFPGDDVYALRTSDRISSSFVVDYLPREGRVIVQPVLYGMYERFQPPPQTPSNRRDALIRWAQDIGRTIDYLETRDDFDPDRIAYFGFSGGAANGPVFAAVEPRIATAILLGGGILPQEHRPEADPTQFAPRSSIPTLLINGRDDFILPFESSQKPFFELLGAPPGDKRHAVLPGGHIPSRVGIESEVVDWLDRHFGPVEGRTPPPR